MKQEEQSKRVAVSGQQGQEGDRRQEQRVGEGERRHSQAEKWEAVLLKMFVPEQVEQVLEVMLLTFDTAVIRECDQTFHIQFSKKGYPLRVGGTNDVKPFNPTMYKAE